LRYCLQRYILGLFFLMMGMAAAAPAFAGEREALLKENFHDLKNWSPLFFPKIPRHTTYTIVTNGADPYLKAESEASASAIVYKNTFSVYEYPRLTWKWKVDSVYKLASQRVKTGDDYPLRVYILFKYDPQKAGVLDKILYESLRLIYGEYPPHSSLNYAWASKPEKEAIFPSPYTDKLKMVLLEAGTAKLGQWVVEDVNILEDYRKSFGKNPPAIASLAIMNDSDNTGGKATSNIGFIEVYK